MELRQLRYFLAIARCRSFSRASVELRIAQPALSSQIAALEAELETQLFLRHSRGVELTEAGRALAPKAGEILAMLDEVSAGIKALGKVSTIEIKLGLPTTMTGIVSIPLMDVFSETHPEIVLHIVEGMTGHLDKWVEQDDIDVAILYDRSAAGRPTFSQLGWERLGLIGRDAGQFDGRAGVGFRDLASLRLIHTTRAHQLRRMLDNYAMETKTPLSLAAEIDSLAQIRTLLYSTNGYTILPESIMLEWGTSDMSFWPIIGPELSLQHHIIRSAKFERQAKSDEVLNIITSVARGLIDQGRWPGATLERDENLSKILLDTVVR